MEELEILRKQSEILKKGLRFYADIDNARVTSVDDMDGEYSPTMSGGLYLTGKLARQVLKECEEMKEER